MNANEHFCNISKKLSFQHFKLMENSLDYIFMFNEKREKQWMWKLIAEFMLCVNDLLEKSEYNAIKYINIRRFISIFKAIEQKKIRK